MRRLRLGAARSGAALLTCALLAGCGGGGGGGSAPGTPPPITSTPAPGTLLVPAQQSSGGGAGGFINDGRTASTYAVSSNPPGLAFTVGGLSRMTPATVTPAASTNTLVIAFASGFSVPIVQVYDGPHTVFYNAASDSSGTVALSSLQSISRRTATASLQAQAVAAKFRLRPLAFLRAPRVRDIDPTRVTVRLSAAALRASGRTAADIERAVGAVGVPTLTATSDVLRIVVVPAGVDAATFTARLRAQPEVAEVSSVHFWHVLARAPTTVSDPYFKIPEQWYSFATGANYAWSYDPGTGAKLAIIDTGIDQNNPDLTAPLVFSETAVTPIDNEPTSANGGIPTCNPSGAATVVSPNTAQDDSGHGTNVAGIAIAKENTGGFAGATWGAKLVAIKVFPSQNAYCNDASGEIGADTADIARGVQDAVAQGADVISLSLGSATFDTATFNAIESAITAGVTVVAAAGNGDDASAPGVLDYPAAYPGVIAVGASALKDEYYDQEQPNTGTYPKATEIVASYSQYGPSLSVVAPGGDALSCLTAGSGSVCNDADLLHYIINYTTTTAYLTQDQCVDPNTGQMAPPLQCAAGFNGTSMATPQVAATAAMLIAEAGGHHALTPAQVRYTIEETADNINDPGQGHGRLNMYRALASLIRDTSAYSGPIKQAAGPAQLVAFAYATGNTNRAAIVDATFIAGVPVAAGGRFRIADVPVSVGAYRVAVWDDANGDGVIDAGDQVGVSSARCLATAPCPVGTITLAPVAAGFYLP